MKHKILLALLLSVAPLSGQIVQPPGQVVQSPNGEPYHPDPNYGNSYHHYRGNSGSDWNNGGYGYHHHHHHYTDQGDLPP